MTEIIFNFVFLLSRILLLITKIILYEDNFTIICIGNEWHSYCISAFYLKTKFYRLDNNFIFVE